MESKSDNSSKGKKGKKRKRIDNRKGYRWRCLCGSQICKELTDILHAKGLVRGGNINIPKRDSEFLIPLWERHLRLSNLGLREGAARNRNYISRVHFQANMFSVAKDGRVRFAKYFDKGHVGDDRLLHIVKDGEKLTAVVPDVPNFALKVELAEMKGHSKKAGSEKLDLKRRKSILGQQPRSELAAMIHDLRTKEAMLKTDLKEKCDRLELAEKKLQSMDMMKAELDAYKLTIKHLETRNEELMDRNEKILKPTITGLHISNLVSDSWHENNKWAARAYFAFPSWRITKVVLDAIVSPETYLSPEIIAQCKQGETASIRKAKLIRRNVLQEVIIALLKMRKNYTIQELTTITDYSRKGLSSLLNRYIPLLGDVGRLLSNFRLEKKFVTRNQVTEFKNSALSNVAVIGDGKDIMSYSIRCHSSLRRAQLSNKEKCACSRGLSFSLSNGLYCVTSPLFLARATEQKIFGLIAPWFDWIPHDMDILYDKGLRNSSYELPNLNKIHTPSFLGKGRASTGGRFDAVELESNREIARLRYTIEVGYSRVEHWGILKNRLSYHDLKYSTHCWYFSHAHSNLMNPLRQ